MLKRPKCRFRMRIQESIKKDKDPLKIPWNKDNSHILDDDELKK